MGNDQARKLLLIFDLHSLASLVYVMIYLIMYCP